MTFVPLLGMAITCGVIWRYPRDAVTHAQALRTLAARGPEGG